MIAWVLSLMIALAPTSARIGSFLDTASDITTECEASTAFASPAQCEAAVVAVAWFESSFFRWAIGDGGESIGLLQIHRSNFRSLGVTRDDVMAPRLNVRAWLLLVGRTDHNLPLERRLAAGLMTRRQAEQRAGLAARLLRDHPPNGENHGQATAQR